MELGEALIIGVVTVWSVMTLGYFVSLFMRNAGFVDLIWGVGFMLLALAIQQAVGVDFPRAFPIVLSLVLIWGGRLALHLSARFKPEKEDWRYKAMRKSWGEGFIWQSYFKIFMLQGLLMLMVGTPIIVAAIETDIPNWQLILGSLVWGIGFLFEVLGDHQLTQFVRTKKKKSEFITSGLWRYTRHPNYFGEVVMWWGLFIIVLGPSYWWLAMISPLTITTLILKVSGIPMLEKRWKGNKQYKAYAARTSAFFPWPPKS